jgi:menaquinone-9 beta-reductase
VNQEVTIAGGGLAGLSLGIALRNHHVPVVLSEALQYPRHRVCGEFISGVSEDTLTALGIHEPMNSSLRYSDVAWFCEGKLLGEYELPNAAYGISRYKLDDLLCAKLQNLGGVVKQRNREDTIPSHGKIWAAGRRPKNGEWIGLKAHIKNIPIQANLEMHMGNNGYLGLAKIEDGWINVCGLFIIDRTITVKHEKLLGAYLSKGGQYQLANMINESEWRENSFSAVAGFSLGKQEPISGMLSIGDSETIIPPFTGNGMTMALQSAEIALPIIVKWSRGEISWDESRRVINEEFKRKFSRRVQLAKAMNRLLFTSSGRNALDILARRNLLPFRLLLSLFR